MPKKPMDPATKLRRLFRKAANDPMAHLLYRGDVYHYHRRVPAAARAADPSLPEAIRRSTGTDRLREARAIVREWAEADEAAWVRLVSGKGPGPWAQALSVDREQTLENARELIEARADALRVRGDLERASNPHEIPEVLRHDPAARPALQAVYVAQGKSMTWVEAWEAFETRSELKHKSRLAYASACTQFDRRGLAGPYEITRDKARTYLRERAQTVTRSTVNVDTAAGTAIMADLFPDEPDRAGVFRGHKLRFAKKAQARDPLTREDIRLLLAGGGVSYPLGLLLRLALGAGTRRQEAYYGDYDLTRKVVRIAPEYAKTTSSAREIPLADRLIPVAAAWMELRAAKKAPSVRALQEAFASARDLAKLPASKTIHSCRHAFVTELARAGVPEDRRKALAGHSKAGNVHAGYMHLSADDLRADVEKVDFETGFEWPAAEKTQNPD